MWANNLAKIKINWFLDCQIISGNGNKFWLNNHRVNKRVSLKIIFSIFGISILGLLLKEKFPNLKGNIITKNFSLFLFVYKENLAIFFLSQTRNRALVSCKKVTIFIIFMHFNKANRSSFFLEINYLS
jgi:hypothetical protein